MISPMNKENLNYLINQTRLVVNHQKEKEILKGEKFNVFSILKMESKENATHSAFLCELLNPEGTHLKGNLFLKLFLEVINENSLDVESCRVKVEHFIGQRNDGNKAGGRIDIYIWDKKGNSLSIENKIYAGDQNVQIERYCNYNKPKNRVYYLTLEGNEATDASKGKLVASEDYYTLSYKEDITKWLQLCMKESVENPILRETIKQYILLINKLTYTMNQEEEKELFNLILQNIEESAVIVNNYNNAIWNLSRSIRHEIAQKLRDKLGNKYRIYEWMDVDKPYSTIWIKIGGKEEMKLFFGIQNFSLSGNNFMDNIFIGVFVLDGKYQEDYLVLGEKFSNWWINVVGITEYDGNIVNTKDAKTLKRLNSDQNFRNGFINHIVETAIKYVETNSNAVTQLLADT
jgi:hypothetical protein